jgi:hypothetical protein
MSFPELEVLNNYVSRVFRVEDVTAGDPRQWIVRYRGHFLSEDTAAAYDQLAELVTPHVAGIVALMVQKKPALTAAEAEIILTGAALPLPAGCRTVNQPSGLVEQICWGDDATGSGLITANAALDAIP